MKYSKQIFSGLMILMLMLITGCGPTSSAKDIEATVAINVAVAQTAAVIQTQALLTAAADLQKNPSVTPSPQLSPTKSFTSTPEKLMLTLTRDTYCRVGVQSASRSISLLEAGQTVEVIARNPTDDSYFVIDPKHSNSRCWLWGEYAELDGEQEILPVYTSVPLPTPTRTPTPAPDFAVTYNNTEICGADYALRFLITNTGKLTWQAVEINITDLTNNTSTVHSNIAFVDYSGCTSNNLQSDLTPTEFAYVVAYNGGQLSYNPAGHSFVATVTLCQTDTSGGCIGKTVSFTP